jgi:nifR3 family TIM-barrel protein
MTRQELLQARRDETLSIHIGPLPIHGDLILSPMDGYSDLPFRSICRELGSAMSYTEFINVLDILQGHPYVHQKWAYREDERPVAFQIFDSEPARLLEAALRLQEFNPDVIDINMGCSVSHVSGRGAGAGLLREPHKIAAIFSALSRALRVPVTGKMRIGWDDASLNYVQVAKIIEDNGGALVAVHGRTKVQAYRGEASWDAVAAVKAAVKIPVIGNGDVRTPEDIQRMKAYTGVDGVMIGRAAIGNPWIFSRRRREDVSTDETRQTLLRHLGRMLAFHGPQRGLILFRKHAARYVSPYPLEPGMRERLLTAASVEDFLGILEEILALPMAVIG